MEIVYRGVVHSLCSFRHYNRDWVQVEWYLTRECSNWPPPKILTKKIAYVRCYSKTWFYSVRLKDLIWPYNSSDTRFARINRLVRITKVSRISRLAKIIRFTQRCFLSTSNSSSGIYSCCSWHLGVGEREKILDGIRFLGPAALSSSCHWLPTT